ncbi:uncharacterized protein DC041_0011562 [Schistosoma bovis]|uniref:HAT C-terminal dimerisation domain-containing protein n=1 Tax=Schistosoma bovis TaxID=6184 RepID=A0A430QG84_SCHBO|nr:uncharacterized protein DC041_0011562 [Schistosoma bovis]
MSKISLNNNNNSGYVSNNNNNNMSCLFPNLTYPSLGQDKFSYMNTLPFMMNGINKIIDMKNQEINDVSLDLTTTSTTVNNNNDNNEVTMITNSNSNSIDGNNYKHSNNNDCNFDIIRNIQTNDSKSCILDMRSNNQLTNPKYSSIEQQMINSSLYSSSNYTVSTKRKRSRPKRSSIESNQSFDGEDMKMKRYHTEKANLSINNHNNTDSCIDDKKSCWEIKQNVQNIPEQDNEEHDSDEEHRLTINQSSSCSSSSSSSSSMSLTRNTFMQSNSNTMVTRNQLSYHVAQYLIKDIKPPETIDGEGFRKRSSIESNQSFDGEDMKMKRYHTEKANLSINNHNNTDSCIDDKKSCWEIKQNVQNIPEQDNEEHDSDEEHRLTINQSSSCSSSSSSSSSMSLTRNTFMQSNSNTMVTRNQLSYHVAQYLIKDIKPPETIDGEGFRKRSSIESNQSFDGEDMKMKRYHTEKANLSINNHNNTDSCIDDKKSCWEIKQNVQNIPEQDNEEHDSDEEHRLTINQSSSCSSSSSSSSSMSLTRNTFMQSNSNTMVTRNQLSYHVAQYLIKDIKPPETIDGEGFRKLLSLFTNHKLPTIKEISEITFPELYTKIEDHLNKLLDKRIMQSNSFNSAISFSIELWNTINNDNNNSNNPNCTNLLEVVDKCRARLLSKLQLVTNENMSEISSTSSEVNTITTATTTTTTSPSLSETTSTGISDKNIHNKTPEQSQSLLEVMQWPVPIITNDVDFLKHLINETESNIIILPCLVSELSKALLVGLNTDIIRNLIRNLIKVYQYKTMKTTTEYSIHKFNFDELKKSNCCKAVYDLLNWYLNEYSLNKNNNDEINSHGDKENINEIDLETIKGIISILDTIGQTLEFIHKKDLILTGSMIKPILTNLCDTRLANESSNLPIVEEFKSTIVSYLMNSFPNNGAIYETLWIASLLDPRFKSQVQDKKPTVIKLLRMKVDAMLTQSPTSNICHNTPKSNSDNQLPSDTTTSSIDSTTISNKHSELETVFGLNYFPRSSLSEVDRYLREDPIGLEEDPYQWWQIKSSNYPNLSLLAMYYLAISLTCITPERLKSLNHFDPNHQSIPDIKLNLLTSIYENKNKQQLPSTSLLLLDLPNIIDVFGQGRLYINNENQIMYNYLWHNWHLTKFI